MAASPSFGRKIAVALLGGLIVGISATLVDLAVISYNKEVMIHQLIGDFIATLVAVLVYLALLLRNEELQAATGVVAMRGANGSSEPVEERRIARSDRNQFEDCTVSCSGEGAGFFAFSLAFLAGTFGC